MSSSIVRAAVALLASRARGALAFSAVALGMLWPLASETLAQKCPPDDSPPPKALMKRGPAAPAALTLPPTVSADAATRPGETSVSLTIQLTPGKICNPATGEFDQVELRAYRDANSTTPGKIPFVAPTIEVLPGETVRLTLKNALDPDPACPPKAGANINIPHCFNSTNMHAHGLWVSPAGNSDNVLLRIDLGVTFQYEYNIPLDHPAGTFWYHPHLHGSTAVQVTSGMAGVLLVRGSRLPSATKNGDIDTLLYNADEPFQERVVLLQQIQYSCRNKDGSIKKKAGAYHCDKEDTGRVNVFEDFGPPSWDRSGRYTSINGQVLPWFLGAVAGRIERWRIVHAGIRDTVKLKFRKMRPGPPDVPPPGPQADWVASNCPGEDVPHFVIAHDGLTRSAIYEQTTTVMQPGYRADLLVAFPESGTYCMIDDDAPASATVSNVARKRRLLGRVEVGPGKPIAGTAREHISAVLLASAERKMPEPVRAKVVADLKDGLKLGRFTATTHRPYDATKDKLGHKTLEFSIGGGFKIDGASYDPKVILDSRKLLLGGIDEWTLTSAVANHPFHIHVNPFQIVRILDRQNKDWSVTNSGDPDYSGLQSEWRDTIFVKQGYKVVIRSRYERYIGDFVLHCHILDHEDQGMMQNVRIGLPDGRGGVAGHGHH